MTEPIRVLIADDHPLFLDGLTALLTDGPDTELVGAATSGTEAVELARETQPDVVVMDVHMPGLNGIEATRRIVADSPHIAVLVLTMFDDDDSIFSALRAGARGYLLKGADQEQIRTAIQAAASGEIIFGTHLAARMLAYFTTPTAPPLVAKQVLLAWKDTREARRAMSDAMPFFEQADRVVVGAVCPDAGTEQALHEVDDVVRALTRRGVNAEARVAQEKHPEGFHILRQADLEGADLIVCGAYGHTRLGEWVFGGVTADLLAQDGAYLLLSH